jgi:predicted DCC family thiol-disulfide oxidoreductase YuxK
MTKLILYTTSHCHLCEQAEAMLVSLEKDYEISWLAVEISEDDTLTDKYGLTIPVIRHTASQTEINWPFSRNDIASLIKL